MSYPGVSESRPLGVELGTSALSLFAGWVALWSWHGLVEQSSRFLGPTLLCGALVATAGALLRYARVRWYAVVAAQLLVVILFFNHHLAAGPSWGGWVPTPSSLSQVGEVLRQGTDALSTQYSPVPADFPGVHAALALCAIGLLLCMDLLAGGLSRVPLAGLPLLVIWMIPISLLRTGVDIPIFVITALLFVMLLAIDETRRVLAWGRAVARHGLRRGDRDGSDPGSAGSLRASALGIGLVACLAALVVPAFIPLAGLKIFDGSGGGAGLGSGPGNRVSIVNPLVDLRRDLVEGNRTPLLDVRTDDPDPSYLRLAVLDAFNGISWRPSPRVLPPENRLGVNELPPPPGLDADVTGKTYEYELSLKDSFATAWLPAPYPAREVLVDRGDWRYDVRTLDFADPEGQVSEGSLDYTATSFEPAIGASVLDDASPPPPAVMETMTALPKDVPRVVIDRAQEITAKAGSQYDKALALQEWFRGSGGFRYSTDRGSGNGMSQLARFITVEKVGYCEQFAAAMATMARVLDIPARVAMGFLRPTSELDDGGHRFTTDDVHAWPELYFTGLGWVRFEPTPAVRTGQAPDYAREEAVEEPTATAVPSGEASVAEPSRAPTAPGPGEGDTAEGEGGPSYVLWLVGLAILALLASGPRLVRDARRRRRLEPGLDPVTTVDGAWAELRATSLDLGRDWPEGRSVRQAGAILIGEVRPDEAAAADLETLVLTTERARYGRPAAAGAAMPAAEAEQIRRITREWCALLRMRSSRSQANRARVWPRSVFVRDAVLPGGTRFGSNGHDRHSELVGSGRPE